MSGEGGGCGGVVGSGAVADSMVEGLLCVVPVVGDCWGGGLTGNRSSIVLTLP